jgi:ABC-2 type transport system ATP-binding protein
MVWIRGLLRELAGDGRAVLVSSHLMSEMDQLADHLVVIGRGQLLADTTPRELRAGHDTLEAAFLHLTRSETSIR